MFGGNVSNLKLCYLLIFTDFRYCPECRNDASEVVLAGEKLKESKKKQKMASANSSSRRDWGKVSPKLFYLELCLFLWTLG